MAETKINNTQTNGYYAARSLADGVKVAQQSTDNIKQRVTQGEFSELIVEKKQELLKRIKTGEEETTFQIGGSSMTQTEWKRLIGKVDHAIEEIKEEQDVREEQQTKEGLETKDKQEVKEEKEIREEAEEEKELKKTKEEKDSEESRVLELLKDRDNKKESA